MAIKEEGIVFLVILALVVILLVLTGIFCHFCAETFSGGHYYRSDENLTKIVMAGVRSTSNSNNKAPPPGPTCKCSKKFKGYCKHCAGEDFVDDGSEGDAPDFSGFGGDRGLDPQWGNRPDPIRSALAEGPPSHPEQLLMKDD